jgi:hypothetical protein
MVKKSRQTENESKKTRSSIWLQILISILIVVVLDFLAGLFIISDNYNSFRTPHYYYHHGLLPNQNAWAVWGSSLYPFNTNSLGMVDSTVYNVKLETDKKRLMILGDSHSEGVGIPYKKTFSGILSKHLRDNIEVLNASCISYSPKIEYLKAKFLLEEGLKVDHIFVLIDISDLQNELVYEHFEPRKKSWIRDAWLTSKFFLKRHSAIFHLITSIIDHYQSKQFFEKAKFFNEQAALNTPTNVLDLYASFFSDFDDRVLLSNPQFHGVGEWYYNDHFKNLADHGIKLGQIYLLKLKKLCDAQNIKLSISVHPWQYQILKMKVRDYYVEQWESFAKANDIDFINLFPLFITDQNPVINIKMYFIQGDNHWNEFGHALVADYLEDYFRKMEISQ